ncbi:MAG TPA: hypothetical protein VFD82_19420 [Planctomycetota bacterium]|nr:hypothetical protein [Planctomycetota bacterium]
MAKKLDDTLQFPDYPAGASGNFVVSAGIRGSEWRVGLSMDVAGLAKVLTSQTPR